MVKTELDRFPLDVLVDATKSKEAVFVDPSQGIYADESIATAFREVDADYAADREGQIRFMDNSIRQLKSRGTLWYPGKVDASYMSDELDADSNELLVVTSPLNDGKGEFGEGETSFQDFIDFINTAEPTKKQIRNVQPNSRGPLTKLHIGFRLGQKLGRPMPTMQIFSRVPPRAFTAQERAKLLFGDWEGHGRVALDGIRQINAMRLIEGKRLIEKVHFFGAGIGQKALAAARVVHEDGEFEAGSVSLQNLALHRGVVGTAVDHVRQSKINEPSGVIIPAGHVRIEEPLQRREQDQKGTEWQMYLRQARAIMDVASLAVPMALTHKGAVRDARTLLDGGVPVHVTNGLNVGMAINTLRLMPIANPNFHYSTIVGVEGQKVGMMANEHAGIVAIAMNLGIRDHDRLAAAA